MSVTTAPPEILVTKDGVPLKQSIQRATSKRRKAAFLLVTPLLLFIMITFAMPIFDMLFRSIENSVVVKVLPKTVSALRSWDGITDELPPEEVYAALAADMKIAFKERTLGRVARRLNYEIPGMSSLFRSSGRRAKTLESPPYKEALIKIKKRWGDIATWRLIKRESNVYTMAYYLAAMDRKFNEQGAVTQQPEERRIYLTLFWRTLLLSTFITMTTFLLGYPIAYLLGTLPLRTSNLLMILVLLPFWTSLLVRTTAWIAMLQREGVINDLLVFSGFIDDSSRLSLIHNATGTVVAMTHILLPFMILPLYSVMRGIPPSYMRAGRSLGANQWTAFWRIYFPQTLSGLGAGGILVFILSIGFYITPALVGGTSGTFISNFIANHISTTLNWGLASALGAMLLALMLVLYLLYDKIVGIDNMKLG